MKLSEYQKLLQQHDWHYQYSDDSRAYKKGSQEFSYLNMVSHQSKDHRKLFHAYRAFICGRSEEPELIFLHAPVIGEVRMLVGRHEMWMVEGAGWSVSGITEDEYEELKNAYGK